MLRRRIDDGLRDGPEVRGRAAAVLPERVDVERQVRQRAPEVDEREAVARAPAVEATVVHLDLAVDRHVRRRGAQPGDLGVVAHLDLQRLRRAAVDARLEEERITVRAHLGVDLLGVNRVDGRLDLPDRHARVEDDHVRPERPDAPPRSPPAPDPIAKNANARKTTGVARARSMAASSFREGAPPRQDPIERTPIDREARP